MPDYPALFNVTAQTLHPLGGSTSFLVGRNETADVCVTDPTCSRHHFRLVHHEDRYYVEPLNSINPTLLDGVPVAQRAPVAHGAILKAGATQFRFLLRPARTAATTVPAPPTPGEAPTVLAGGNVAAAVLDGAVFPIAGATLVGREAGRVQVHLPHPQVSRLHACITRQGATTTVTDLGSANGTFLNGDRIRTTRALAPGDQLDVGPYALRFTGAALVPRPRSDNVELVARGVRRVVRRRDTGDPLVLLDDVTLVIRPREFVCLLGPSGSGKSTLLSALGGRLAPDAGAVLLNGKELHAHFEALKQDVAVVPQKDVLHDALAVGQALWYTAKLRLPPDTSAAEIEAVLAELLDTVGLADRRATAIRHLSGGQVKRASLANEILCKPSLLLLDEVTSGLDEQTDREAMRLFRTLADAGKTVVCVTHSLANVERTCHLVVVLTPGGKLAFVGKPAEALTYFGIDRLGDVYERLAQQPAEKWQTAFRESPLWRHYVADRLPADAAPSSAVPASAAGRRRPSFLRQTLLLTRRFAATWRGDPAALAAVAGQTLVVALLLGLVFGNLDRDLAPPEYATQSLNLMFLLAVSSFWFGCNNAAKEIVRERAIYTRERDFNLRVDSYFVSKLLLLTAFSSLQALLLFAIVAAWCHPPGSYFGILVVLLVLAFAGVTLGLAISVCAATEAMAVTLIPVAVIPQIILSGTIAPLEGVSRLLALVGVSTYWGKRGLDACMPERVTAILPDSEGRRSVLLAVLVLLVHAAAFAAVALVVLHRENRRRARRGAG